MGATTYSTLFFNQTPWLWWTGFRWIVNHFIHSSANCWCWCLQSCMAMLPRGRVSTVVSGLPICPGSASVLVLLSGSLLHPCLYRSWFPELPPALQAEAMSALPYCHVAKFWSMFCNIDIWCSHFLLSWSFRERTLETFFCIGIISWICGFDVKQLFL